MSGSFGGTVKLQGESEYRKALREITSNLKLVSSELKLTNAQFMSGDNTLKQTKSSYKSMQTTLEEQKEKVSNLRNALKKAETQYGSNNEKVKQFKTQLNNAETQLKKMEDTTDKSNKELKDMNNNFNNAGQGAVKFGDLLKANVIGDVITSGLKAVGNGIKKLGSALVNVGKQAVNSYANYEQLIGGVKTLFKESSEIVENYANNAYKNAGLSANQYMETVTSFSASLLQSLNGNTAKAAEVSNRAIVDMSDNANKMGTSMESIQNAYQGFAKQNYTMLDNLKLGYGGTKTEMERLVKDASKMKDVQKELGITVDKNNMSFGNIVNAISVMQSKMGIAGTTAKEASETISGSVSSMKSAWQNLLTGIADDNANFGQLISNFVDSVLTASNNLLPRIKTVLGGIGDLIVGLSNELLPKVLEIGVDVINNLLQGIQSDLPNILNTINNVITNIITSFIGMLPQIVEMGMQLIFSLIQGISQQLPTLIPQMVDAILTMVETLLDNIDMIIDAGIQLILGLADGLIEALPILIEKIPEIIQKLFDAFIENFPKIVQAGGELIGKLLSGITGSFWKILEVAPQIISNLANGIQNGLKEIHNVGKYLVEGLWNGISGMASWVYEKITSFAKNIVGNIKNALGIHSPSAVLRDQVGKFMAQGIGIGFENEMGNVTRKMQDAIPTKFDVETTDNLSYSTFKSNSESKMDVLIGLLNEFLPQIAISNNRNLVLDTGELVGATANMFDTALGNIQLRGKRGN